MHFPSIVQTATTVVLTAATLGCGDTPTQSAPAPGEPALITNGTPTGSAHGNVGALLIDEDADGSIDFLCSGSLIAETVFLTAGHCVDFPAGALFFVTFAPDVTPLPSDLIPSTATHLLRPFGPPHWGAGDLGVVILPAGATSGIQPLELPPEGFLDEFATQGNQVGQHAVNVGYGIAGGRGNQPSPEFDGVRKVALTPIRFVHRDIIGLFQNTTATGEGGTCFGDSGSPLFLEGQDPDVVVGVLSYTNDPGCHSIGGAFRLDTPTAREFLDDFVTLP
jgi:hypothetical protein